MVEKTSVVRHFLPQKTKRVEGAPASFGVSHVAPLVADAKRSQPETRRSDAPQVALIRLADIASVADETRIRVRLFPKKSKICSFEFLKQGVIAGRENRLSLE
jgi:hypothetical protein